MRKALVKAGGVNMSPVLVLANAGAVTLIGAVPDEAQIDIAQQHAQAVAGVSSVASRLTLATAGR
ncbi:BON domain-containing protein [Paraburkholderia sp. MMS20-SJTN17]|uniref:BON domain-containing protein n=2 Tax=Paraburkholderia translucens TaxID=2886945 RepID=A0ABS8KLF2_9BURK|nr:BON domain-containing protein [Paraburkholderia sp. MMS20-SJTN17]